MFEELEEVEGRMNVPNTEQIQAMNSADLMALLSYAERIAPRQEYDVRIFMYTTVIEIENELRNRILNLESK